MPIHHNRHVDSQNIETLLFESRHQFYVRTRDLSAGENISIVKFTDRVQAEAYYIRATAIPTPTTAS